MTSNWKYFHLSDGYCTFKQYSVLIFLLNMMCPMSLLLISLDLTMKFAYSLYSHLCLCRALIRTAELPVKYCLVHWYFTRTIKIGFEIVFCYAADERVLRL